eukprot:Skav230111  [mRNA]  locus=scaffold283:209415:216082:- [translate_table: standard]
MESTFERPADWLDFGEHWCPAGLLSALIVSRQRLLRSATRPGSCCIFPQVCAAAHTHVARADLRDEEEPEVLVDWKSACVVRAAIAAIEAQANPCRACGRQVCRSDFSAVMQAEAQAEVVQTSVDSLRGVEMKPREVAEDVDMEPQRAFPELQETAEPFSTTSQKMSQAEVDRDSLAQSQCKAAWLVHLGPVRCHRAAASFRRGKNCVLLPKMYTLPVKHDVE